MTNIIKNKNNFIQYELWKECKIGCAFCYNKGQPDINKLKSLDFVLDKIIQKEVQDYNEMGFIGGEFFNGELKNDEVKSKFYNLILKACQLKNINVVYIATSLMYNIEEYLIPFLDYLKTNGVLNKISINTSYDLKYRFNESTLKLWNDNMIKLHELYHLPLHTEMIVTQFFIDAVLNNEFSLREFSEKYHTRIDYIEPYSGFYYKDKRDINSKLPDFFPTKESFIKFLKQEVERGNIDLKTFLSHEMRSNTLYYIDNMVHQKITNKRENCIIIPLDRTKKYESGFIDFDEALPDIVQQFYKIYGD